MTLNLMKLLNELKDFESTNSNGKTRKANVDVAESFLTNKRKKQRIQGKVKPKGKNKKTKKNNKGSDQKPKGKCFYCNQEGHWKRNSDKYLNKQKKKKE